MQLAGWKVLYQPKAFAYHKVSATSSQLGNFTRYHATKNFLMLYVKNMPSWLVFRYLPLFIIKVVLLFGSSLVRLKGHVWLMGFLIFVVKLPGVLRKRHHIQRNRKMTVDSIHKQLIREFL